MKTLLVALCWLSTCSVFAQYNALNLSLADAGNTRRFGNLELFPILANERFVDAHRDVSNFVPLKKALEKNMIEITEVSAGNVNSLFVRNISKDTVIILSGEVVQGGKQDRLLARDVILYPDGKKLEVPVFCVEHGRWSARQGDMSFKSYYTISGNEVRKTAAVQKDQREVWNKVADATKKNKAETSTGTLTALKNSGEFETELKKYKDHFEGQFVGDRRIIGLVAVSGSEVMACDMFATHEMFAQHYVDLLNSYASEAITSGKPVTISHQEVGKYLDEIISDEQQQDQKIEKKGMMLKEGRRKLHISTF